MVHDYPVDIDRTALYCIGMGGVVWSCIGVHPGSHMVMLLNSSCRLPRRLARVLRSSFGTCKVYNESV